MIGHQGWIIRNTRLLIFRRVIGFAAAPGSFWRNFVLSGGRAAAVAS
jgi:hypothetical protein